jgi:site-specific DNA recombinase
MTRQQLTLDGYVRVSDVHGREGDSFISPEVQREQIAAWAKSRGVKIVAWHEDLDISGGKRSRAGLDAALDRIRSGETGGVAVARLDRLSRLRTSEALALVEEIDSIGGKLAAIDLGIDPTTPFGEFAMTIMLALAHMERRRITDSWREARVRAVKRGVHLTGVVPFGYARTRDGRLVPDPEAAPFATELFRRRAAGATFQELRDWLIGAGVRTRGGGSWSVGTLQTILRNRVYLGEARGMGEPQPDAHQPLVDPATWQAVQGRRGARPTMKAHEVVSAGLVRCAACRYTMSLRSPANSGWQYLCRRKWDAGDCPDPTSVIAITANGQAGLDRLLVEAFFARLERIEFEAVDTGEDIDSLEAAVAHANERLEHVLADTELEEEVGRRAYRARVRAFQAAVEEAEAALERALQRSGRALLDRPVRELRDEWFSGRMPLEEKRRRFGDAVQAVFIRPGPSLAGVANGRHGRDPAAVERRVRERLGGRFHVVWADEPPVELPRRGNVAFADWRPTPFVFPDPHPSDAGVAAL